MKADDNGAINSAFILPVYFFFKNFHSTEKCLGFSVQERDNLNTLVCLISLCSYIREIWQKARVWLSEILSKLTPLFVNQNQGPNTCFFGLGGRRNFIVNKTITIDSYIVCSKHGSI